MLRLTFYQIEFFHVIAYTFLLESFYDNLSGPELGIKNYLFG